MSERLTASVHGPTSGHRSLHFRQKASARSSASNASIVVGRASVREDEGNGLTGFDRELTNRFEVFTADADRILYRRRRNAERTEPHSNWVIMALKLAAASHVLNGRSGEIRGRRWKFGIAAGAVRR
jgi:hypothetical protein